MNSRKLFGATLSGLLWSFLGTELMNGFGIDGIAAPQFALGILAAVMAAVMYRYEESRGMQFAMVIVAGLGFVVGFYVNFALRPGH